MRRSLMESKVFIPEFNVSDKFIPKTDECFSYKILKTDQFTIENQDGSSIFIESYFVDFSISVILHNLYDVPFVYSKNVNF